MRLHAVITVFFVFFLSAALLHVGHGQALAPSPVTGGPSNDGTTIDQGIAYVLLLIALAVTYLVH